MKVIRGCARRLGGSFFPIENILANQHRSQKQKPSRHPELAGTMDHAYRSGDTLYGVIEDPAVEAASPVTLGRAAAQSLPGDPSSQVQAAREREPPGRAHGRSRPARGP